MKFLTFLLIIAMALPVLAQNSNAQDSQVRSSKNRHYDTRHPSRNIERRVQRLESEVSQIHHRLKRIEDLLRRRPPRPEPREYVNVCMLVDNGYSKTFLGKARSQIDAEYMAKRNCEKSVHPSYCGRKAELKCDNNRGQSHYSKGYVCLIRDSGYGKVFRGEGETPLEAEAKAKQSCQSSLHPSYCGKVSARCEELR